MGWASNHLSALASRKRECTEGRYSGLSISQTHCSSPWPLVLQAWPWPRDYSPATNSLLGSSRSPSEGPPEKTIWPHTGCVSFLGGWILPVQRPGKHSIKIAIYYSKWEKSLCLCVCMYSVCMYLKPYWQTLLPATAWSSGLASAVLCIPPLTREGSSWTISYFLLWVLRSSSI